MHWTKVKIFKHIYVQLKYLGLILFTINIMYIEILWRNEHMREQIRPRIASSTLMTTDSVFSAD